jgi:hypothetical protein
MEAQTLLDYGASTCFINKELVRHYKLGVVENNTSMSVEVIDGQSLSSKLVTHETKVLDFTISFHTNKVVVFYAISLPKNHVIIGLYWLVLPNAQVD